MESVDIVAGKKYSYKDLIAPCNWGILVVGTVLHNRVVVGMVGRLRREGTVRNLGSLVVLEEVVEVVC